MDKCLRNWLFALSDALRTTARRLRVNATLVPRTMVNHGDDSVVVEASGPLALESRNPMMVMERGILEIRDHVLWPQHIENAPRLCTHLLALNAGEIVCLKVDGKVGVWAKMRNGTDGRRTTGMKPGDVVTRQQWHALFRDRLGDVVLIEAVDEAPSIDHPPHSQQKRNSGRSGLSKGTTRVGFTNRNNQTVLKKTDRPGNDHNQIVYILKCNASGCGHEYGSNGSDIFQRRCPKCGEGAPGLRI
jgi:hypothetical protein